MQSLFLASLGIITERNKIASTQPGSLTQNSYPLVCRSPGVTEGAPSYSTALTVAGLNRTYLFSIDKYVLIVSNRTADNVWVYRWFNANTGAVDYGPLELENSLLINDTMAFTGRFGSVTVRDRTIVTCSNSNLVWDYIAPSSAAQATARTLGMPSPSIQDFGPVSNGTAVAVDRNWSATAVIRRRASDGYEIFSAPFAAVWLNSFGAGGSTNTQYQIIWSSFMTRAGDIVEIYRTKTQAFTLSAGTNTGSDYFLSDSITLTTAQAAAGGLLVVSTTPDAGLGEALYTNTGVSGGNAAALTPPTARMVSYYRGHTFYSNYTQGSALEIRVPSFWGTMGDSATGLPVAGRKTAIGLRNLTGTATNGNPTITGVSAGDIVGITIGQAYYAGSINSFTGFVAVTAVGATTITFAANATATSGVNTHTISDVIEVTYAGVATRILASSPSFFAATASTSLELGKFNVSGLGFILSQPIGSYGLAGVPSDVVTLYLRYLDGTTGNSFFSARATNGNNYVPRLPRIEAAESPQLFAQQDTKNGVAWSEKDQPEYWCGTNIDNVGGGEILAVAATRDALWFFCTDGIWRWSGTGGSVADGYDWRLDPIDKTFVISGPQAWCVLRDNVYAYGNRGYIMIDSAGNVTEISSGRCDDVMPGRTWIGLAYPGNAALQFLDSANGYYMVADDKNNEVVLKKKDLDLAGMIWIYNVHQDCVTRDYPDILGGLSPDHGVWNESKAQIYHAVSDTGSGSLLLNTNTTTVSRSIRYEFQPVVTDDPFTLRQFQRVEVVFDLAVPTVVVLVCRFNDDAATDQSRTFAAATGPSVNNRLSFIVPRNAPAVANTIKIRLIATGAGGPPYIRLLGVALKYSTPTEQRKAR